MDYRTRKDWVNENYSTLREGQKATASSDCKCFRTEIEGMPADWACGKSVERRDGDLYFYCFKPSCSLGGGVSDDSSPMEKLQRKRELVQISKADWQCAAPSGLSPFIPERALEWLAANGIDEQLRIKYGIQWSTDPLGIFFPVKSEGFLTHYQIRRSFGADGVFPKWKSVVREDGSSMPIFTNRSQSSSGVGFLVEDIPSAIRLDPFVHGAGILGTKLSTRKLTETIRWARSSGIHTLVIALDPNTAVEAADIKKALTSYVNRVIIHTSEKDPKHWSNEYAESVLRAYS